MECRYCGSDGECYYGCQCAKCIDPEGYEKWIKYNPEAYEDWLESQMDEEGY